MGHKIDTTIQFSGLKSGVYNYDFTLDNSFFSEYKNEKILEGKVVFNVRLEKKERLMMFFFDYSGEVLTTCDRCLGEMTLPLKGSQTLCVKFSDTEQSDDEDVVFLPEKAHSIDLAQWMYEYVAVEIPIQCIHENDAEGNPTCDPEMMKYLTGSDDRDQQTGTDLEGENAETQEIDPRWDVLKTLKNK